MKSCISLYTNNLIRCKDCHSIITSTRNNFATLLNHVMRVIKHSTNSKMFWVYAAWIVARMHNNLPLLKSEVIGVFINKSVSANLLSIFAFYKPISIFILSARPYMAIASRAFPHFAKKTLNHGFCWPTYHNLDGDVLCVQVNKV